MQILGERINLRDFIEADVPVYVSWNSPGHAWQHLDGPYYAKPTELDAHIAGQKLLEHIQAAEWPRPRMRLAITNAETNELIGVVTSYWESEETNWLSLGIVIFDEMNWRSGFGREALAHWVDYLSAARPEIVRLDLRTWSGNTGMMRLAEKLGFQQEACFRQARIVEGIYYDGLAYGILRTEWTGGKV